MFIGEKIKEISATISYNAKKPSERLTLSGSRSYCAPKWENTQSIIVSNQITIFFASQALAVKSSGCRAFWDTAEMEELINVMLKIEEHLRHLRGIPEDRFYLGNK